MISRLAALGLASQIALAACASSGWRMQSSEGDEAPTETYGYYYSSGPEAFFEKGSTLPVTHHTEVLSSGSLWQGEELGEGSRRREMRVELGPSFNDPNWRLDLRSTVVRGEEMDEDHQWLGVGPRVQATYTGFDDLELSASVEYLNGIGTYSRRGSSINLDYQLGDEWRASLFGEMRDSAYMDYGELVQETSYSGGVALEYTSPAGNSMRPVFEIGTIDWSYGDTKDYYRVGLGIHYELPFGLSIYAEPALSIYTLDSEWDGSRRGLVRALSLNLLTQAWKEYGVRAMLTYYVELDRSTTDSFSEFDQRLLLGFEREF